MYFLGRLYVKRVSCNNRKLNEHNVFNGFLVYVYYGCFNQNALPVCFHQSIWQGMKLYHIYIFFKEKGYIQ